MHFLKQQRIFVGDARGSFGSYMAFKAIDVINDGYVMVGDDVVLKNIINNNHGAYIVVVDFDSVLKTIDKSVIDRNTAINYTSSALSINAIFPDKEVNKITNFYSSDFYFVRYILLLLLNFLHCQDYDFSNLQFEVNNRKDFNESLSVFQHQDFT